MTAGTRSHLRRGKRGRGEEGKQHFVIALVRHSWAIGVSEGGRHEGRGNPRKRDSCKGDAFDH